MFTVYRTIAVCAGLHISNDISGQVHYKGQYCKCCDCIPCKNFLETAEQYYLPGL